MPVRYIHRTVARARLPGLYRASRVALVTPLRDGMNLVAKEFVAVQDPEDPGVLVLSRFAGAADELPQAIIINPLDPLDTVESLFAALTMPLAERKQRWQAMYEHLRMMRRAEQSSASSSNSSRQLPNQSKPLVVQRLRWRRFNRYYQHQNSSLGEHFVTGSI